MALRNSSTSWGWPARLLHWVMAAIMLGMVAVGLYSANVVEDLTQRFELVQLHKSFGFVVFVLALLRLAWRATQRQAPALPEGMKAWEVTAAKVSHLGLYVLMFALPLTGWLMASASRLQDDFGIQNRVFDLFALPDPFVPGDKALSELLADVHFACAMLLLALLVAHVGASLKHHFVKRDNVLKRMTFGA